MATINFNAIRDTGQPAIGNAIITPLSPNVIRGNSLVTGCVEVVPIGGKGDFSITLVAGVYAVVADRFRCEITVPDTDQTYDFRDLLSSAVTFTTEIPNYGFPAVGSNYRIKVDGTFQLLDPDTGLYYTPSISAVGGLHEEWGPGEL